MKYIIVIFLVITYYSNTIAQLRYYFDAEQSQGFNNSAVVGADGNSYLRFAAVDFSVNKVGGSKIWNINLQYSKGIKLKNGNILGFAVGATRDVEGVLSNNGGDFAAAYHFKLNKKAETRQHLSVGSRLQVNRKYLNDDGLRWPSQIDPDKGFDPSIPSGEDYFFGTYYIGLDLGVNYAIYFKDQQFINVGASVQDINRPNISINENGNVPLRTSVLLSITSNLAISKKFYFEPELRYFKFHNTNSYIFGGNLIYKLTPEKLYLKLGGGLSQNDRYNVALGADISSLRVRLSYGWQQGFSFWKGLEVSMNYRLGQKDKLSN